MMQKSFTASVSPAVEVSPLAKVVTEEAGRRRTRGSKRKAEDEEVSAQVGDGSCRRSLRKKIKF